MELILTGEYCEAINAAMMDIIQSVSALLLAQSNDNYQQHDDRDINALR